MKTFGILLLLLLCGCASTSLDKYQATTPDAIQAKIKANNSNDSDMYNQWRYAGSDDTNDYFYEYKPGIFLSPPSNFKYYKLPKGQLKVDARYPFNPDIKKNTDIFSW